jgi:prepilin-type N-terminal cleavage/methylation domain-containing protein
MVKESDRFQDGFTLLELLVVIFVVGIISTVVVPGWLKFLAGHRMTLSQDKLRQGIQQAQVKAQQESISWQFSVRENLGDVEMAVHPAALSSNLANWEPLNNSTHLDSETSFASVDSTYYVQFDEKGNVRYRLGRVTISDQSFPEIKRCVIVSTLIGAVRTAKEKPEPVDGKFCY